MWAVPPGSENLRSTNVTSSAGSSAREGTSTGRSPIINDRSATRAERLAERPAANVAMARTRAPPAVASDEIVTQSATGGRLPCSDRSDRGRERPNDIEEQGPRLRSRAVRRRRAGGVRRLGPVREELHREG